MSIRYNDKSGGTPQEVLLAGTPATDLILNGTSKNPIANKTVYNALATKIESTVENLVNFYNKSQVYNKQEVRDLIGAINTLTIEVVNELPTQDISATTIYFLKQSGANTYDEYIYVDNAWVKIGDTDIDLSGYLTTANFQIAIADYYTKSAIDAMIANYYTKTQVDAMVDAKQDELTFDNAPTAGSDNPVKSGGIKTALDAKQNTLTFDSTPTASSSNPVTSDGIKDAIDDTATDIYEVMGKNGAKNLLRYPYNQTTKTISGITFTDNGDGSITANGTATASVYFVMSLASSKDLFIKSGKYTISGCPSGGSSSTYRISCGYRSGDIYRAYGNDVGNGFTFTATSDDYSDEGVYLQCACNIDNGTTVSNIVFKPMIRLAEDTDSTYQPYAETNYQLTQGKMSYADNSILGAKNLLPIEVSTQTISSVTYTINSDGTMDIQGQNTSGSWISLNVCSFATLKSILSKYKGKQMIFSITSDYDYDTRNVCLYYNIGGTANYVVPNPKEKTFTVPNNIDQATAITVPVGVNTGETASTTNLGIMLRLANDADSNYAPYAMTNRELTEHHTTVAKTFTQSSTDVATYLRNANTSGYIAFGYSYNRTMITVNAIFTIKASGNALYKSDGTTATSGNENWELIKIPDFPYSKAIPDGPLSGLLFLNTTDLKDLYCRKSGNDLIFTISATDYASFVGKGIRLSATIMLK